MIHMQSSLFLCDKATVVILSLHLQGLVFHAIRHSCFTKSWFISSFPFLSAKY